MMNHEIRVFLKDGAQYIEIYKESFKTADDAYKAYKEVIDIHNGLPKEIRKEKVVARFNGARMMTIAELH